jgi:hypothetical protein
MTGLVLAAAIAIATVRTAPTRAIASGLLYGVADAAIKAVSVRWGAHGADALLSGWTVLALAATLAGFVSFQAALRARGAVAAISLMNCLAALVALVAGLAAFGESLGTGPAVSVWHFFAIGLVLACVPVLASAQAAIADSAKIGEAEDTERRQPGRTPRPAWPRETALQAPARSRALETWPESAAGQQTANGEQPSLQPRAESGGAREEGVAEVHIAGH